MLRGGEPGENAQRVERLLADGKSDAAGAAAVTLNAGAALYVAGLARTYKEGVALARETLAAGTARERLAALRRGGTFPTPPPTRPRGTPTRPASPTPPSPAWPASTRGT